MAILDATLPDSQSPLSLPPFPTKPTQRFRKLFGRSSVNSAPSSPALNHATRRSSLQAPVLPLEADNTSYQADFPDSSHTDRARQPSKPDDENEQAASDSLDGAGARLNLIRRMSRMVVSLSPRTQIVKRHNTERRTNLAPIYPTPAERRAASTDRRSQLSQRGSKNRLAPQFNVPSFPQFSPAMPEPTLIMTTENAAHRDESSLLGRGDTFYPSLPHHVLLDADLPHGLDTSTSQPYHQRPYSVTGRYGLDGLPVTPTSNQLTYADMHSRTSSTSSRESRTDGYLVYPLDQGERLRHHHLAMALMGDNVSQRSAPPVFFSGLPGPSATSVADARSVTAEQIELELETVWILNLSMRFRDRTRREKFFITYRHPDGVSRRVTVSIDYLDAPAGSLEAGMAAAQSQRAKSARIYEAVRDSLREIRFYHTVTNLRLQTDRNNDQLHVHVAEDMDEVIAFPAVQSVQHLGCRRVRERDILFDSHMSGFVFKVRIRGQSQVLIKKEIPGSGSIEEFLYEINALTRLKFSRNVIHLYGVVVDDADQHVKGVLVSFAEYGALADVIFDHRVDRGAESHDDGNEQEDDNEDDDEDEQEDRNTNPSPGQPPVPMPDMQIPPNQALPVTIGSTHADLPRWLAKLPWSTRERWARQIVGGLADIHETGFVQGDFTLTNIVIDADGDAKIIDINRRGCPARWHPPEATPLVDTGQQLSMYIGVKSDLFQLGMVLWALATLEDEPEAIPRPLRFSTQSNVPPWYQHIVETCLSDDPRRRAHASYLLNMFPCTDGENANDNDNDSNNNKNNDSSHSHAQDLELGLLSAVPSQAMTSVPPITLSTAGAMFADRRTSGPSYLYHTSLGEYCHPGDTYIDINAQLASDLDVFGHPRGRSPASMRPSDPGLPWTSPRVSYCDQSSVAGTSLSGADEQQRDVLPGHDDRKLTRTTDRDSLVGVGGLGALGGFDTFAVEGDKYSYAFDLDAGLDALVGAPDDPHLPGRPDPYPLAYPGPTPPRARPLAMPLGSPLDGTTLTPKPASVAPVRQRLLNMMRLAPDGTSAD